MLTMYQFNQIPSEAQIRTFIRRMYHHVTVDKLESLVRKFCYGDFISRELVVRQPSHNLNKF